MSRLPTLTQVANIYTEKGSDLNYQDLKRGCIVRGMPFEKVLSGDFFKLSNWLVDNFGKEVDESLLDEFDDWMDNALIKNGSVDLVHPSLRLGYVKRDEDDEPITKKPKVVKEKKAPREKDERGLFKGTMKSYTYLLQSRGKTLEQVTVKVMRKFPQAKQKSIKIWYNKAKKGKV